MMKDLAERLREYQDGITGPYQDPLCLEAADRIEALEAENEEHMAAYRRVAAERDRLRAALRKYGMHGDKCGFTFCRCGLSEALAAVEGEGDE
jgi:histidinol-phosphate/aromatic aminotransferase/cobyric acid decarboxylase-like protein